MKTQNKKLSQLTTNKNEDYRKQQDLIEKLQDKLNEARTLLYEMNVAESTQRIFY